jgi:hypothetical protein
MPFARRAGSRAGFRAIMNAASRDEPLGSVKQGVWDLMRSNVSGSCELATEAFDNCALPECSGESRVVSGVPTVAPAEIREALGADVDDERAESSAAALKTEEPVLA